MRETTEGLWVSPQQALAGNLAGRIPLSPPTLVTLQELLNYPTLNTLRKGLEGRGWGEPIFPRLVRIDANKLPGSLLPAGVPFSRLWNEGGIWKPVA
ncbi:MAG: hydrolase, family [Deltaproteobacteria bacterium]|nr:hydrolase, family [Deltaproteobacteria bacterium]